MQMFFNFFIYKPDKKTLEKGFRYRKLGIS